MKKIWILLCMFLLCLTKMITANYIKSVIPVDFLHVEVVMAEPLSKEELDTSIDLNKEPLFLFNNGIIMIGKPILQNIRGYENTYRIPVKINLKHLKLILLKKRLQINIVIDMETIFR